MQAEAVEHLAHPGVAGPGVLRRVAEDSLVGGEVLGDPHVLGEHADPQPAGVGDPARLRLLDLDERPEQRGLAAAVAADHADAVALGDAERHGVEQLAGAVAHRHLLHVDEVDGHQATTRAPVTGPSATRTRPAHPGAGQRCGERRGVHRVAGEQRDGRPAAGHHRAERAELAPGVEHAPQRRAQRQRRRLQVVGQRAPDRDRVARAQRLQQLAGVAGDLHGPGRPLAVELAVHRRGRQAAVGDRQDPGRAALDEHGREPLAAPGGERGAAVQRERHVAAELRGEPGQLLARQARAPQRVAGDQGRGCVRRAARAAAGDRDALVQRQGERRVAARGLRQQAHGADREVVVVDGQRAGALTR